VPKYSNDWFSSRHPQPWAAMFHAHGWNPHVPHRVMEIGTYEGQATAWILENLLMHPQSRITCVDTFEGSVEHSAQEKASLWERFSANMHELPAARQEQVIVERGYSSDVLVRQLAALPRSERATSGYDFIYVDGSHTGPDVLLDLTLAFELLQPNGLIVCDDYGWALTPAGTENPVEDPKMAIDAFVNVNRQRLQIVYRQPPGQFAFAKRP